MYIFLFFLQSENIKQITETRQMWSIKMMTMYICQIYWCLSVSRINSWPIMNTVYTNWPIMVILNSWWLKNPEGIPVNSKSQTSKHIRFFSILSPLSTGTLAHWTFMLLDIMSYRWSFYGVGFGKGLNLDFTLIQCQMNHSQYYLRYCSFINYFDYLFDYHYNYHDVVFNLSWTLS